MTTGEDGGAPHEDPARERCLPAQAGGYRGPGRRPGPPPDRGRPRRGDPHLRCGRRRTPAADRAGDARRDGRRGRAAGAARRPALAVAAPRDPPGPRRPAARAAGRRPRAPLGVVTALDPGDQGRRPPGAPGHGDAAFALVVRDVVVRGRPCPAPVGSLAGRLDRGERARGAAAAHVRGARGRDLGAPQRHRAARLERPAAPPGRPGRRPRQRAPARGAQAPRRAVTDRSPRAPAARGRARRAATGRARRRGTAARPPRAADPPVRARRLRGARGADGPGRHP